MGDPRASVPYHDPHEYDPTSLYTAEQLLLNELQNDRNPILSDIYNPLTANPDPNLPSSYPSSSGYNGSFQQSGEGTGFGDYTCNSFHSPTVRCSGFGNGSGGGAGPSSYPPENLNYENAKPLPIWPQPPSPYSCSFCQVLREIVHTNGNLTTRLELHGRLGMICHAILENRHSEHLNPPSHRYQMFDFCKKSIEDVKQFLRQYCEEKSRARFELVPDPLSLYYEAVCTGLVWDDIMFDDADYPLESSPTSPELAMVAGEAHNGPPFDAPPTEEQPEPAAAEEGCNGPPDDDSRADQQLEPVRNNQAETNTRTFLALQRKRTRKLTLMDLAGYFHLPIEDAARELNLCVTALKKICRRNKVHRWPSRKIRSIKKRISELNPKLASENEKDRQAAQAEMAELQNKMATIYRGVPEASQSMNIE